MIDWLRPYPEMKPSGLAWLGDVPAHWDVGRAARLLSRIEQGWSPVAAEGALDIDQWAVLSLSAVRHGTFVPTAIKPVSRSASVPSNLELKNGDFLLTRSNTRNKVGDVCVVDRVRPKTFMSDLIYRLALKETAMDASFMMYQLLSNFGRWQIERDARGSSDSMPKIGQRHIKEWSVVAPPLDEQRLIVRFLDWHGAQTAKLIRAKKKLIALLNEQKQAIIHHAVTRGLDPNVRLKPSGIPWLGDVPEGWEVKRLRRLATKFGSGVTPKGGATGYTEDGVMFLRSQNIHFDGLRLQDVARIPQATHEAMKGTHVRACDVLLNITGASIGRACAVPVAFVDDANVNQHVCILRVKRDAVVPEFLAAVISTPVMQREIRFEQNGASREGLTLDAIKSFAIPLPPLSEQQQILESINLDESQWDAVALRLEREISLTQEFRARLIADIVTRMRIRTISLLNSSNGNGKIRHL